MRPIINIASPNDLLDKVENCFNNRSQAILSLLEKEFNAMENKKMSENVQYGLDKVYDYKELPDKISGRCDNCNQASFTSRVGGGLFIRECNNCGMKKSI